MKSGRFDLGGCRFQITNPFLHMVRLNVRILYEKHSYSRLSHKLYSQIYHEFCPSGRLKAMLIPPCGIKTGRFRVFLHGKSGCKPYGVSGSS